MINNMKQEIKRSILHFKVVIAIFMVFTCWYICGTKYPYESSWIAKYIMVQGATVILYASLVFSGYACTLSFCEDYEHSYFRLQIQRKGVIAYTIGKMLGVALVSFITYFMGSMLYALFLSAQMPPFQTDSAIQNLQQVSCFGYLLPDNYWLYIIIQCVCNGLLAMIVCCGAVCVSAWITNKFVTLCMPMILFWVIFTLAYYIFHLPSAFDWDLVFSSFSNFERVPLVFWLKIFGNVIGYMTLFCVLFLYKVKRRYRNE